MHDAPIYIVGYIQWVFSLNPPLHKSVLWFVEKGILIVVGDTRALKNTNQRYKYLVDINIQKFYWNP